MQFSNVSKDGDPVASLDNLFCCSTLSVWFSYWGSQTWIQYSWYGLTKCQVNQHFRWYPCYHCPYHSPGCCQPTLLSRTHCWLLFSPLSTSTSSSCLADPLPSWSVPRPYCHRHLGCPRYRTLHLTFMSSYWPIPPVCLGPSERQFCPWAYWLPPLFSVICKHGEGVLHLLLYVIDNNTEQEKS